MNNTMNQKNEIRYNLSYILFSLAVTVFSGVILQSFLLESGITETQVSIYVSMTQIIQVLIMMFFSGQIDKLNNIIKMSVIYKLACLPMFLVLLLFCIFHTAGTGLKFWSILIVGLLINIPYGLHTIIAYKLPYQVIDMKKYGTLTALGGFIIGIGGIVMSSLFSFALDKSAYYRVFPLFFVVGAIMLLAAAFFNSTLKKTQETAPVKEKNAKKINLLKYRPFYQLILPNLFRGFCAGIVGVIATIGYYYDILDSTTVGYLAILTSVSGLLGSGFYSIFSKKGNARDGKLLLILSISVALLFPFMIAGKSAIVFLVVSFIVNTLVQIINYAVPVLVVRIIDYEIAGQYTAWRMLMHTLGSAVAGFVCILMLDSIGGIATLLISGVLQMLSGIAYYIVEKKTVLQNN